MDYIITLLKIICRDMSQDEKTQFLRSKGFYSFKAIENAPPEKVDDFKSFLENEVNKLPDYRITNGYLIRKDQSKPSFMLIDEKM